MLSSYTVFVRIYAQIANAQAAFTLCFAEQKQNGQSEYEMTKTELPRQQLCSSVPYCFPLFEISNSCITF